MLTQDEAPKVTLRLSGKRTDIMKLNSGNITLIADLSRIYSAGEQSIGYTIIYPGDLPNNAFEIVSQTPKQITLSVAQWKSKEVEVQVNFNGTAVPEQYIAFKENATLEFDKITVTGPAAIVDRIDTAKINVDLTDKTDTITQKFVYALCDAEGEELSADELKQLKTSAQEIQYTLKIQRWKDIELRLDVIDGGGLKRQDCLISALPTIRVSGNEQALQDLGDYLVLDEIRLAELTEDFTQVYEIIVPEGITNLSEQSTVTVSVDIPQLEMLQLSVTEIRATNVPTGMSVELITKEKSVTVRGPKEKIKGITEKDLLILVDFTEAEVGTASYKATVAVGEELADFVGIVGTYDVKATVQKVADGTDSQNPPAA
jgi:YbbR domain-containing protein